MSSSDEDLPDLPDLPDFDEVEQDELPSDSFSDDEKSPLLNEEDLPELPVPYRVDDSTRELYRPSRIQQQLGEDLFLPVQVLPFDSADCKTLLDLRAQIETPETTAALAKLNKRVSTFLKDNFGRAPVRFYSIFHIHQNVTTKAGKILKGLLNQEDNFDSSIEHKNRDARSCFEASALASNLANSKELLQSFVDTAGMPKIFQKAQDTKQTVSLLVQNVCPVSCAYQFRGFVSGNKVTGLCQRFHTVFFDQHTKEFVTELKSTVNRLWPEIHKKLGLQEYIFDFAFVDKNTLQVTRVMPFEMKVDGLLFDWRYDADRLQHGPFTLKIRLAPFKKPLLLLPNEWRAAVCKERKLDDPSKPKDHTNNGFFRAMAIVLIVLMTAMSLYIYFSDSGTGQMPGRRRRRRS